MSSSATDCFVGEIRLFAGRKCPDGWAFCNGQTLPITDNQTLYSLIGTTYGGDGRTNFALPNLQGRLPIGQGQGTGSAYNYVVGQDGGQYTVTLAEANMPAHSHTMAATAGVATSPTPQNCYYATVPNGFGEYLYSSQAGVTRLNADAKMLSSEGGGVPHVNVMPTACVTYIIALTGLYPDFP
jgi:microcystin-dependent protein